MAKSKLSATLTRQWCFTYTHRFDGVKHVQQINWLVYDLLQEGRFKITFMKKHNFSKNPWRNYHRI